ncbi:hypothetical protein LSTR_LSTR009226 [Laodelphax striatellus]|uniref:Uncharacterized protein n=1 Tax=Laodelphax striatellus TaxID=195883 RepID=A0A482XDW5_LAOST|nr:hypothetical protein LSTR_LSTR009226 [Laodelphax striatellus]
MSLYSCIFFSYKQPFHHLAGHQFVILLKNEQHSSKKKKKNAKNDDYGTQEELVKKKMVMEKKKIEKKKKKKKTKKKKGVTGAICCQVIRKVPPCPINNNVKSTGARSERAREWVRKSEGVTSYHCIIGSRTSRPCHAKELT